MPCLISHLSKAERATLFDELNYLNISEFRSFCDKHGIPYRIQVATAIGRRATRETDRKSVVLDRIRCYLKTGRAPGETCFPASSVNQDDPPASWKPSDRLYYGWYEKKNSSLQNALHKLTDGKFRDGAIARILMREFWTQGQAPALKEFATAWLKQSEIGLGEHPEAAWLTDRARKQAGKNWKAKRKQIALRVLEILREIPPK